MDDVSYIDSINNKINSYKDEMISSLSELVGMPAISPEIGGKGELERAGWITEFLKGIGVTEIKRYDYTDTTGATRPNIVSKVGTNKRTIWILCHMDTVAAGDLSLWKQDPFKAYVEDGKIYGRGTNDNGQSLIATLYAAKAIIELKVNLQYNFGMVFVADEEIGSHYGAERLAKEGIFGSDDMMLVPDWGVPTGDKIEIAEKSILWIKVTASGKQVHASTPEDGVNAYKLAVKFLNDLDDQLHSKYNVKDERFDYPVSSFEMTKHDKNVDSINIIPGKDVSYIDCRVLPNYKLDEVIADMKALAEKHSKKGKINIEVFNREDAAKPTDANSEIVQLLSKRINQIRKISVSTVGIGGGTVAKYFRDNGVPVAVWSTEDDVAHQPNEYSVIDALVSDSKVFASLVL
ncbi:succinyl-diaminopimelate desuccinylase [Candidatus Mancarchaeum acidiphilum]|uniref:Succinyl-diaminopimelate desuccinylase n=1 Tax=Candidatus Mancarchaeum acidiphilum TaxID=1920749 RepID=A0A218NNP1_9ARCH|nr:M20 family metallo-hydrolase [Candidatus Mancarchaeum acidiphilum]ASI14091.1 succinyl-diaminopimelate desuccinylase [Candidatus Mancarchaeum acidiphilum]